MARSIFDDRTTAERIADMFKVGGVIIGYLVFLAFLALMGAILGAWGEMLFMGILHGEYWHHLPTMSFATAFKLNLVVIIFAVVIRGLGEAALAWFKDLVK